MRQYHGTDRYNTDQIECDCQEEVFERKALSIVYLGAAIAGLYALLALGSLTY